MLENDSAASHFFFPGGLEFHEALDIKIVTGANCVFVSGLSVWLTLSAVSSRGGVEAAVAFPQGGGPVAASGHNSNAPGFATTGRTYRVTNHDTVRLPCQTVNAGRLDTGSCNLSIAETTTSGFERKSRLQRVAL